MAKGSVTLQRQPGEAFALGGVHAGGTPAGDDIDAGRDDERHDGKYELPVFVDDATEHGWWGLRLVVGSFDQWVAAAGAATGSRACWSRWKSSAGRACGRSARRGCTCRRRGRGPGRCASSPTGTGG